MREETNDLYALKGAKSSATREKIADNHVSMGADEQSR
jgi:hypothetical protein